MCNFEGERDMRCKNCGTENSAQSKFCQQCGRRLFGDASSDHNKNESHTAETTFRNDTICPFCTAEDCVPMQKSTTAITKNGYRWGSGCCGMFLFGPFGLLCGLLGSKSKTDITSELWWTCKKCGKQHIALEDALKKWENSVNVLPLTGVSLGITSIILKAFVEEFMWWFWGEGFITSTVVFLFPIVFILYALTKGVCEVKDGLARELGGSILPYFTEEQMAMENTNQLIAVGLALGISLFGIPVLNVILGE